MDNDMKLIGLRMKESGCLLCQRLSKIQEADFDLFILDHSSNMDRNFFYCLGDAIYQDEQVALDTLKEWAYFQIENAEKNIQPISSWFPDHVIKSVLMDFLEEEIKRTPISPNLLIQVIKKIDSYIHYTANFFSNPSCPTPKNDSYKFSSPIKDERFTLQELNDLKNALKEATILTITDKDDIIRYANEKFCSITKYSSEELIGQNHHNLLYSGYHDDEYIQSIRDSIQKGKVWKGEIRNKAKDGSFYWVDTTIVPFLDYNGKTYQHISIQHDITDKKNTEEMLRKSEKLSLVGELAAGIAHEIRNPLTTIRGFVQILDHFSEEKKFLYSKTILDEIDRINFIVSEFMVFARPHTIHFNECNLTDIIKNVTYLLEAEATMKNVEITYAFHLEDIFIYGEKNQLAQVLLNMVKNSIDALPNGGKIKISITSREDHVVVSIQDNGIGMTKEQINKIGEPFYTTKENGNGLGLMVSYKIIENHRGRIIIDSELNKGSTFNITFPILHREVN